jgi:hypothetical protein
MTGAEKDACGSEEDDTMGYGQFTGNKSVHWSIDYDNLLKESGTVRGRDPIPFKRIGRDRKRNLTPGNFRARLRYDSLEAAKRALQTAAEKIQRVGKNYFLVFDVPAVERERDQVDPPNPPSEIRVDW